MSRPFLDTSVLVAGMIDFGDSSQASIHLLDQVADQRIRHAATAWHCCLEFYPVATRLPEEYRLPIETAQQFVDEEIMGQLEIRILSQTDHKISSENWGYDYDYAQMESKRFASFKRDEG